MKRLLLALMLSTSLSVAMADIGTNMSSTLLASGARTAADVHTADLTNTSWKGVSVIVDVTAFTSGTYTPHIQAKDSASGKYYDILVGAAISGTGTTVLKVYPGITPATNTAVSDTLPKVWRLQMVGASTPVMTYSAGAFLQY